MLEKVPQLKEYLDGVFLDTMENDFNFKTGAWPEMYMFTDKDGKAVFKHDADLDAKSLADSLIEFASKF